MVPGLFAQTHAHPEWLDRAPVDLLWDGETARAGRRPGPGDGRAAPLRPDQPADQPFRTLSGGQQARFQILLLELSGATLLLLDEPTDNLDVLSAEALEEALAAFDGTVLAVTHDRWFARSLDRFLVFGADGRLRVRRARLRRVAGAARARSRAVRRVCDRSTALARLMSVRDLDPATSGGAASPMSSDAALPLLHLRSARRHRARRDAQTGDRGRPRLALRLHAPGSETVYSYKAEPSSRTACS